MSEVKTDKISPSSGTATTIGDSGDTFTVPSGVTLTVAGALNVTGTTSLADGTVNIAELDIDGGTDINAAIVDADLFVIDDGAGGTNRKTAASRLKTYVGAGSGAFAIGNLDIDGGTDINAAIVDADLFVIDDGAGGTNRKTAASRIKTYIDAPTLANDSNNRVVTGTGSGLNGEANLTFDGSTLGVTGAATVSTTLGVTGVATFSGGATLTEDTLTDASTITWDASTSPVAKVTLGANRTLGSASSGGTGQFISLLVIQDGTGSRTLTWNAAYEFKDDTAPTLTTTASKGDLFVFRYNGSKWLEVGRNTALTLS